VAHAEWPKGLSITQLSSKEAFTEQVLLRYAAMELERIQDFYQRKELRSLDRLKQYFATLVDRQGQNSSRPGCLLAYLSLEVSDKGSQLSRSARTSAIGRSGYGPRSNWGP
jgi:AcrR family transcriptional regulator